jgi:uncharacterized protein (TIGR04141 family)
MAAQRNLTIYLISKGLTDQHSIVKPGMDHYPIAVDGTAIGDLYVKPLLPHTPPWVELFTDAEIDLTSVQGMSTSAVLVVHTASRSFAVTFGSGRSILQSDTTEDRFGLKVTLNAVDPAKIRSVERLTVDSPAPHSQIQARAGVNINKFGLNIDQDLLREVIGTPRDTKVLGQRLAGKDALHATGAFTLKQLPALLRRYLAESKKTDYRDHFPWVDHIQEVKNTTLKEDLDKQLQDRLQRRALDKIWLAVPEIIDWDSFDAFTYRDIPSADRHADIDLSAFLDTIRDPTTITAAALKRYRVYAVTDTGDPAYDWSAYQCVYAELKHGTHQYLLNSGTWFQVEPTFRKRINDAFNRVPHRATTLPDAKASEIEEAYNKRVVKEDNATFALMDRKNIRYPDPKSPIEFCDLYTSSQELIHVKPYSGSSTLSHLFAQGVTSGQLFAGDAGFRTAVNEKLPERYRLKKPTEPLPPRTYTVTYAIIRKGTQPLFIPFFSKVSLNNAVTNLRALGYTPQITKIAVSP